MQIFRIQYHNTYRRSVIATFIASALLTLLLAFGSFIAEAQVSVFVGVVIVIFSLAPAGVIYLLLWAECSDALEHIVGKVTFLEEHIVTPPDALHP
jgi:hypothetical protein